MSIAIVQAGIIDVPSGGSNPYSFTYPSNNVQGNTLLWVQRRNNDQVTAITDTQGNTWVAAGSPDTFVQIWYVANCKAGANTLTLTAASGGVHLQGVAAEYSGCDLISPVDKIGNFTGGSGSTATSISITPSFNNSMIVGWTENNTTNSPNISPGAGYTMRTPNFRNCQLEDQLQGLAAGITSVANYGSSVGWVQNILALKAAVVGANQLMLVGAGV